MALFKKDNGNKAPAMPPEVTDYYKTEKRERMGLAWLMGLVTLLITILIAFGLFLGGRWIYRNYIDKPDTPAPTVNVQEQNQGEAVGSGDEEVSPDTGAETTTDTPDSLPAGEEPEQSDADSEDLPNTGPGETAAIFLAVSVFGYLAHRRFSLFN